MAVFLFPTRPSHGIWGTITYGCLSEKVGAFLFCASAEPALASAFRGPWEHVEGEILRAARVLSPISPSYFSLSFNMSASAAVPRTAPIAIAPKPPRFPPSRQGSITIDSFHNGGLRGGLDSPDSGSVSGSHSTPPCEACLRRRSDCVVSEDDDNCVACQYSGTECSLVESPLIRKRKLNGDAEERGGSSKRR